MHYTKRQHIKILTISLVAAIVIVTGITTFAASTSKPNFNPVNNCPQSVETWLKSHGWKDATTYQCSSRQHGTVTALEQETGLNFDEKDALAGSIRYGAFRNIADLARYIKESNKDKGAVAMRKAMRASDKTPGDKIYNEWVSGKGYDPKTGDGFVAVQFKKPATIKWDSRLSANGRSIQVGATDRKVKAGDVLYSFVYDKKVRYAGNVRAACSNPQIKIIIPRYKQTPNCKGNGRIVVTAFVDKNGNGQRDAGEKAKVKTKITLQRGKLKRTLTTNSKGQVVYEKLAPGTYTITEQTPKGYIAAKPKKVVVEGKKCDTDEALFANKPVPTKTPTPTPTPTPKPTPTPTPSTPPPTPVPTPTVTPATPPPSPTPTPTVTPATPTPTPTPTPCVEAPSMIVDAFVDTNGNGVRDSGEAPKVGARFEVKKVGSNDAGQSYLTDEQGKFTPENLEAAKYAVTEVADPKYTPAVATQEITLALCEDKTMTFANKPVVVTTTPPPEEQPVPDVTVQREQQTPVQQIVAVLPQTGQGALLTLLTFLGLAGAYYVYSHRRHQKQAAGKVDNK